MNYAVRELNNGNFLPNTCEEYEVAEDQAQQEERIMAGIQRMNEDSAPASHPEPLNDHFATEVQDTVAVGEDATDQDAVGQRPNRQLAAPGSKPFQRMVEKFEAKEGRERNEQQQSRQNAARARSRGDKMRRRLPPSSEVNRLQDKPFVGKAEREAQQARERREPEI